MNDETAELDSTTIDLWLSLFPWARFRRHTGKATVETKRIPRCPGSR